MRPFQLINLKGGGGGKLVWYATKTATDMIARKEKLRREIISTDFDPESFTLTMKVRMSDPDGRVEETLATVFAGEWVPAGPGQKPTMKKLAGEAYANALMKLQTKAFRRGTLSWAGLVDDYTGDNDDIVVERFHQAQQVENLKSLSAEAPASEVAAPVEKTRKPRTKKEPKDAKILETPVVDAPQYDVAVETMRPETPAMEHGAPVPQSSQPVSKAASSVAADPFALVENVENNAVPVRQSTPLDRADLQTKNRIGNLIEQAGIPFRTDPTLIPKAKTIFEKVCKTYFVESSDDLILAFVRLQV
jgi:hypothetical protein